jgi:hypothetical protein
MACDAVGVPIESVAHATVKTAVRARPTDAALTGLLAGLVPGGHQRRPTDGVSREEGSAGSL